jgi:O-antigen/teichoic acid export membrane protein
MNLLTKSLYWSVASKLASSGLLFLSSIILTRYLDPNDFGIVALSLIYVGFINLFVDGGFGQAIIQKKDVNQLELSSCYWFLMACGLLAVVITYFSVPIISAFLNNNDIRDIVVVQSLIFLALPLRIVTTSILSRDLRIDLQAKVDTFWMTVKFLASIIMAIEQYGVWSLVTPTVATEFAVPLTLMIICRWKPDLAFSYVGMKPLLRFGLNITGSRIIWYFNTRADQFIVGRFLGAEMLGIYSLAQNMANSFTMFAVSFSQITYPLLSKLQDDAEKLWATFQKVNRLTCDFYMPIMAGIILTSPELVKVLFTDKWVGVAFPLQMLCMITFIRINESNVGLLLNALGQSKINLYFNCFSTLIIIPVLFVGCRYYGLAGLLVGLCLASMPLNYIITAICCKKVGVAAKQFYVNIVATFKIVLMMVLPVMLIKYALQGSSSLLRLVLMALSGSILYVGLIYVLEPVKWQEILGAMGFRKAAIESE